MSASNEDIFDARDIFGNQKKSRADAAKERREQQKAESQRIGEGGWNRADEFQTAEIISLSDAIDHFGFMSHGSQVIDLRNPKIVHSLADCRNLYAASLEEVGTTKDGKPILMPVINLWSGHLERKHAFSQTFHPDMGQVCEDPKGRLCFNKWRPIQRRTSDISLAQPFIDHVIEIFGEDADRFLDWLAHIEQKPGELPHTGWLHIADNTGTGRNWISSVLCRVWAGYVASNFDLVRALGNGFNDRLESKLLAQVDEIREGGSEMWEHHESLKSMVNPEFREINPKYGRKHVEFNVCRWLIFSNSILAIPLTDTDRRFEVVRHMGNPKEAGYYAKLYGLLGDRAFINAVGVMLRNRDISQFNPGDRAKNTHAKQALIEANKSEIVHRVETLMAHWPIPWINSTQLRSLLHDEGDDDKQLTKHMLIALKEQGATKISGYRQRFPSGLADVWQLKRPEPHMHEGDLVTAAVGAIRELYPARPSLSQSWQDYWHGVLNPEH